MSGIIENAKDLKQLYLKTDITDISSVQRTIDEIKNNAYASGKEKYLEALNAANPSNISKARLFHKLPIFARYAGWIIMAVFAIWMGAQDWSDDSTWQSLGFWVGAGIQIYITVLKSAWNTLTLSGSVIHAAIKSVASVSGE